MRRSIFFTYTRRGSWWCPRARWWRVTVYSCASVCLDHCPSSLSCVMFGIFMKTCTFLSHSADLGCVLVIPIRPKVRLSIKCNAGLHKKQSEGHTDGISKPMCHLILLTKARSGMVTHRVNDSRSIRRSVTLLVARTCRAFELQRESSDTRQPAGAARMRHELRLRCQGASRRKGRAEVGHRGLTRLAAKKCDLPKIVPGPESAHKPIPSNLQGTKRRLRRFSASCWSFPPFRLVPKSTSPSWIFIRHGSTRLDQTFSQLRI